MKCNIYNPSHCLDLTAKQAIDKVDREIERANKPTPRFRLAWVSPELREAQNGIHLLSKDKP